MRPALRRSAGSNESASRIEPLSRLYKRKKWDRFSVPENVLIQRWEIKYP